MPFKEDTKVAGFSQRPSIPHIKFRLFYLSLSILWAVWYNIKSSKLQGNCSSTHTLLLLCLSSVCRGLVLCGTNLSFYLYSQLLFIFSTGRIKENINFLLIQDCLEKYKFHIQHFILNLEKCHFG